jgi:hypothetical protein
MQGDVSLVKEFVYLWVRPNFDSFFVLHEFKPNLAHYWSWRHFIYYYAFIVTTECDKSNQTKHCLL